MKALTVPDGVSARLDGNCRPYGGLVDPLEARLVLPFYLKMLGLNAPNYADGLWMSLVDAAESASQAEVEQLLTSDDWRPVVMGSWFSLKFDGAQIGPSLLAAVSRSQGSLTAPSLAVSASLLLEETATSTLVEYVERDLELRYGSATFVAAVVESLGGETSVSVDTNDRDALSNMMDVARRLQSLLIG